VLEVVISKSNNDVLSKCVLRVGHARKQRDVCNVA
jgi:hypothetical protein